MLRRWTNYTCFRHDYRPSVAPQIVPAFADVFFLQHVNGAEFVQSNAIFSVPKNEMWGKCIKAEDSIKISDADLSCENQ